MGEVSDWSTSAAGNAFTAGLDWREGMDFSKVNDNAREMMAQIRRAFNNSQVTLFPSGGNDTANIAAALASGASIVNLAAGNWTVNTINVPEGVTLRGQGKARTAVSCASNATPFVLENVNDAAIEDLLIIAHPSQTNATIAINATTKTVARCRVKGVQVSGSATDFPFISLFTGSGAWGNWAHLIEDVAASGCGTLLKCETTSVNSWINSLQVNHVFANDFIRGIQIIATAGDGCSESTFLDWAAQTSARTEFGLLIADVPSQGISRKNSLHDVRWYDLVNGNGVGWFIGNNVQDTSITGSVVDDPTPQRFIDEGVRTLINGHAPFQYLSRVRREQRLLLTGAVLSEAVAGSGTTTRGGAYANARSGATAGSLARIFTTEPVTGLATNSVFNTDFGKPLRLSFVVSRVGAGASAIGRVQYKTVTTDGVLAAPGVGIQVNNYAVTGECFGSTLGTVNLGLTMVDSRSYHIEILHYPGRRVEWWVDGIFAASVTTTTALPTGSAAGYFHTSISNVAANDCQLITTAVEIEAGN